ncbi:MAG TPA: class I SAM-dependent methyltransferase [Micropepsaceae bacterium]|nr:class I SAM-dependent methyltransferase [Micropepsaceae bacterium]
MDDYQRENRAWWDELAPLHVNSPFYKTGAFKRGENVLDPIARERLAGVAGKRLLHLQCHFGLDTLSLARMGAEVTGLDFSSNAIEAARALSQETGVPARFIEADVLDPPADLKGFDIVFASWGAIGWIGDLSGWMRAAAGALKPGGRLLLIEGHPAMFSLDDQSAPNGPLTVRFPYDSTAPIIEDSQGQGSYAAPDASLKAQRTVGFAHGLSRIFTAAIDAGFVIRKFEELDRLPWDARLPQLAKVDEFYWALPRDAPFFPLSFALDAKLTDPHGIAHA